MEDVTLLKRSKKRTWWKVLKIILFVFVLLFISIQIVYDRYIFQWSAPSNGTSAISSLIITAIQNLNQPAVIEPTSKKIYLPDASIILPEPSTNIGEVLYNYVPAADSSDAYANVTLSRAQSVAISKILAAGADQGGRLWTYNSKSQLNAVFSAVPNAQACSRGYTIDFGTKKIDGLSLQSSKKLADGRTMQIYKEAPGCSYDLQPLLDELAQAQSY